MERGLAGVGMEQSPALPGPALFLPKQSFQRCHSKIGVGGPPFRSLPVPTEASPHAATKHSGHLSPSSSPEESRARSRGPCTGPGQSAQGGLSIGRSQQGEAVVSRAQHAGREGKAGRRSL